MKANCKPAIDGTYRPAEPPLQPKRDVPLLVSPGFGSNRSFGSPHREQHWPGSGTAQRHNVRILSASELLAPASFGLVSGTSKAPTPPSQAPRPAQTQIVPAPQEAGPGEPQEHVHHAWSTRRGLSRRVLTLACSYMEDNLGENFSLDDLARAVGVSRFHFSRLFRVSTGESPMVYSLRLRIARAKEMLLQGDRKICEVAMTLGFFDQSHFSRTFRRMTGLSPGEYVRMCDVAEVAV